MTELELLKNQLEIGTPIFHKIFSLSAAEKLESIEF